MNAMLKFLNENPTATLTIVGAPTQRMGLAAWVGLRWTDRVLDREHELREHCWPAGVGLDAALRHMAEQATEAAFKAFAGEKEEG